MTKPTIRIFGVPMDLGQQRRGVDMGPSALRYAGLQARLHRLGYEVIDNGNLKVDAPEQTPASEAIHDVGGVRVRQLKAVLNACEIIYESAQDCALPHGRLRLD